MSEEKYGAGQQQLALLQAALEAESNMNPPIWIIGSGMVLNANGKGIPSTKEFAERYLEAFRKLDESQIERIKSLQDRLAKGEIAKVYQEASDLFFPMPKENQTDLEKSWNEKVRKKHIETIRGLILNAWDGPRQAVDQPKDLEQLVRTSNTNNFWSVRPGLKSLAKILIHHPGEKNHAIFTTNFDPLISVALIREGCMHTRVTFEDEDYPITRVYADVPVVYHVHGYWTGRTTLNTGAQFAKSKQGKFMKQSMMQLFHDRQVIVLGYGGWDDILMAALNDSNASIYWCHRRGAQLPANIKAVNIEVSDIDKVLEFLAEYTYRQANPATREASKMREENEALLKEKKRYEEMLEVRRDHKDSLDKISKGIDEIKRSISTIDQNVPHVSTTLKSLATLIEHFDRDTVRKFDKNVTDFRKDFDSHRQSQHSKLDEIKSGAIAIKSLLDKIYKESESNKKQLVDEFGRVEKIHLDLTEKNIMDAQIRTAKSVVESILEAVKTTKAEIISTTEIEVPSLRKIHDSAKSISTSQKEIGDKIVSIGDAQNNFRKIMVRSCIVLLAMMLVVIFKVFKP